MYGVILMIRQQFFFLLIAYYNINTQIVRHPIEHPPPILASMTLPTRPNAIFSTLQAYKTQTQSRPCKELKCQCSAH